LRHCAFISDYNMGCFAEFVIKGRKIAGEGQAPKANTSKWDLQPSTWLEEQEQASRGEKDKGTTLSSDALPTGKEKLKTGQ
jgi:hypothetical protein